MSASLLQKTLKLLDESENNRKDKKKRGSKTLSGLHKTRKSNSTSKRTLSKEDRITENVKKLKNLDSTINSKIADTVFSRKFTSEDYIQLESKEQEEETVFKEEDFEQFEKEYFVS